MNTNLVSRTSIAAFATLSLLSATAALAHATPVPQLRQVGATAVVYRGADIEVALSYRFAKVNTGGKWLLLDVGMTAAGAPVEITRDAISLRTPSGRVFALASEKAFLDGYPELAPTIARARVAAEPLSYFKPQRAARLQYFARPGRGFVYPSVWLDVWHNTFGNLYFRIPDGVQHGRYELRIDRPENPVTIPFEI